MTESPATGDLHEAARMALGCLPEARAQASRGPGRALSHREAVRIWYRVMEEDWPEIGEDPPPSSMSRNAVRELTEKFLPSPRRPAVRELKEALKSARATKPMDIDDALLGGLAAALIALSGHWLARQLRCETDGARPATSESEPVVPEPTVAVLVINVAHGARVLDRLEENPFGAVDAGDLRQATDFLWQAPKPAYETSDLPDHFDRASPERATPSQAEQSEHDIRFVRVTLPRALPGLRRDASQTDRYDAFETLIAEVRDAKVSPRLAITASDLSKFYKR